jgi:hypothetical protein
VQPHFQSGNSSPVSLFIMWSFSYSSLALAVLAVSPSFTDGRHLRKRDCEFTWPATDEDTCATMSRDWALDEASFQAMNPGVNCPKLVANKEYCVQWTGPLPTAPVVTPTPTPAPTTTKPTSTTLATTTRSAVPGGPAVPSPVQSGVAANCESSKSISIAFWKLTKCSHRSKLVPC